MSGTIPPLIMTAAGPQPTPPATLNATLIASVASINPGYTVLPAGLIEDLSSTATGALVTLDQERVELINSVSPLGANQFILNQLGQIYGVPQGQGSNGSAFVVFSGPPGFVIQTGFLVSDGSNQYAVQFPGGVVGSGGQTQPLLVIALTNAQFSIPANVITNIATSVPNEYTISCTNPLVGTPLTEAQTPTSYRVQVLQAGMIASVGTPAFVKTMIGNVPGTNPALISATSVPGVGWKIIVGGSGDPYLVGYAILQSVGDIATLTGSTLLVETFTSANPGVVTTNLNHGYSTGQVVQITGALPSGYSGSFTITVIDEKTFSVGVNTSGFGGYVSGGVITPNFRNVAISISQYPDIYSIPYVIPPSQSVTMAVSWNTVSSNFVSSVTVAGQASSALALYVNSLGIGQPINVDVMISIFQAAVASALPAQLISTLTFSVAINGVATSPESGTVLIYGDPESYFVTTSTAIVVEQI